MSQNPFSHFKQTAIDPPRHAIDAPLSDTVNLDNVTRSIYVGTAGNVKVTTEGGEDAIYVGVVGRLSGFYKRIWVTGTTAEDILVEW